MKKTLFALLLTAASASATTTFNAWSQYDFVAGGAQDFTVGTIDGVDCVVTIDVSGALAGGSGANFTSSGSTGGVAGAPVYGTAFTVTTNWDTNFTVSSNTLFVNPNTTRIESAIVSSDTAVSLTSATAIQADATATTTNTTTATSSEITLSQPAADATPSTFAVNWSIADTNTFTYEYSSCWNGAGEVVNFTFDLDTHTVPEPSSAALLGLGGLALLARRKR